ncbi:MAG: ATP-binding protein, partial [Myxococcales bacterium]|nr:ATP-binding protein [Myxococcales bacterium]
PVTMKLAVEDGDGNALELAVDIPQPPEGREPSGEPVYLATVAGPSGSYAASWPPSGRISANPKTAFDHPLIRNFGSIAYLRLDAASMVETSVTDEEEPRLSPTGAGLASTLAWLAGAKPERLREITTGLARVVPGVRRVLVHRERIVTKELDKLVIDGQPVWRPVDRAQLGDRFSIEFEGGTEVPADLLSEGTVLALGLLTKLHEPERPRVLLLDDIDRGLHIGAQARLVGLLRELMALDPRLQIVCTTHSAYLLDLFEPAEVRVLDIDATRATHAKPLTAHPEFDKWQYGTQTGELWAAVGDDWVSGSPGAEGKAS